MSMEENLEYISPILPMDFFLITCDLCQVEWNQPLKKKHQLPNFSDLLFEENFTQVYVGWNQKGLQLKAIVNKSFEQSFFPEFRKGDSIEIFVDTRDLKSMTQFCHHFVVLPKPVEDIQVKEITVFKTEDQHELANPNQIFVSPTFSSRSYQVEITLPSEILHGYDPSLFTRLGFAYRINGKEMQPNHFTVSSEYFNIEQHPNRWASIQMQKE